MENWRNLFSWTFFFGVVLMFILSTIVPEIVGIILAPVGIVLAVITAILDCFGKFNLKEQSIKWFIYSLLVLKLGQLYELNSLIYIATGVAVVLILVFIVRSSQSYDKMLDEARKIDNL